MQRVNNNNSLTSFRGDMMAGGFLLVMMATSGGVFGGPSAAVSAFSTPATPTAGPASSMRSSRESSSAFSSPDGSYAFPACALSAATSRQIRISPPRRSSSSSTLSAVPLAAASVASATASTFPAFLAAVSALAATIAGGLFSGSLHAVAGPDHLAALIPKCCGLRWHRAARVGAVWGCGHGASATMLGVAMFAFKRKLMGGKLGQLSMGWIKGATSATELAIGASLVIIGLLGIREANDFQPEELPKSLSAAAVPATIEVKDPAKRAVLLNGMLHGFSWDGAPSLAPALAVATWRGSLAFLGAYAVGTALAMTAATAVVGELTFRAGKTLRMPDLPRTLAKGSSSFAVVIGVVWCGLALR